MNGPNAPTWGFLVRLTDTKAIPFGTEAKPRFPKKKTGPCGPAS
jgi:hypothetical protein